MGDPRSTQKSSNDPVPRSMSGGKYVLGLDVGTTTIRAIIYDARAQVIGTGTGQVELLYPKPGWVEICPNALWESVQKVIKDALQAAELEGCDITCMGITHQRNTFITWDKETGQPYHQLIVWQDLRTASLVEQWNKSYTMTALRMGSQLLYTATRKKRFLCAAKFRFMTGQVTVRLHWILKNNSQAAAGLAKGRLRYGALDTWLLWKLTGGSVWSTDYTNASISGLFDPFTMSWSSPILKIMGIPVSILPPIVNTNGDLGVTDEELFGASIPITAMMGDQHAALFGHCCFSVGDLKCSLGTGTFLTINTGSKPHASVTGIYPGIAWKTKEELVYMAEGYAADTGRCIQWLVQLGVISKPEESEELAASVEDSEGVYFVPAFSGIQAPVNNNRAATGLIGITQGTSGAHVTRAVLESLAFRCKLLHDTMGKEISAPLNNMMSIDGGVTKNGFLVNLLAVITRSTLCKPEHTEIASLGAAFMAGLHSGVWKSKEELQTLQRLEYIKPEGDFTKMTPVFKKWQEAVQRTLDWYS